MWNEHIHWYVVCQWVCERGRGRGAEKPIEDQYMVVNVDIVTVRSISVHHPYEGRVCASCCRSSDDCISSFTGCSVKRRSFCLTCLLSITGEWGRSSLYQEILTSIQDLLCTNSVVLALSGNLQTQGRVLDISLQLLGYHCHLLTLSCIKLKYISDWVVGKLRQWEAV